MLIGLTGYAQSGKDTVADFLVNNYGYRRVAFADQLREALYRLNPKIDIADMVGVPLATAVDGLGWENVKVDSQDARQLLQRMGTEVGRQMFGENFWVDRAMSGISKFDKVVFTDVRFPNEYRSIKSREGAVWRISRSGVGAVNSHASETAMDSISADRDVANDFSKEDLYATIDYFMQHV